MSTGFTDRRGVPEPARPADPHRRVTVLCRLVLERREAIEIVERGTGITAWLPKSQIKIEEGGLATPTSLSDLGGLLRVTLPAWLAAEKGLSARPPDDHPSLF